MSLWKVCGCVCSRAVVERAVYVNFPHHSPSHWRHLADTMEWMSVVCVSTGASCGTSKVHSDFPPTSLPFPSLHIGATWRIRWNEWVACVCCRAVLELAVERAKSTRTFHTTRARCPKFTGASRHADSALRSPYSDDDVTALWRHGSTLAFRRWICVAWADEIVAKFSDKKIRCCHCVLRSCSFAPASVHYSRADNGPVVHGHWVIYSMLAEHSRRWPPPNIE